MRWLEGIINSMDMSLSNLREIVKDREVWSAAVHLVTKSWTQLSDWATITMYNWITVLHSSNYHYIINQLYFYFFNVQKLKKKKKSWGQRKLPAQPRRCVFKKENQGQCAWSLEREWKQGQGESKKSAKNSKKPWEGFNRRQMPSESHLWKITPATVWVWRMAHKVPRVEGYCKFQVSKDAGLD